MKKKQRLVNRILKILCSKKKIKKPIISFCTVKYLFRCLVKIKNWVWSVFITNIENFTVIFLRIAFTVILIAIAFYLISFTSVKYLHLFNFEDSPAVELGVFNQIDNEVLLAILSLLIAFTGLLAFIFRHLVRDSLHKEFKTTAHDERLASNAETRLASSNTFSKLHEMTEDIDKTPTRSKYFVCKVHETFKENGFLEKAIEQDKLATQSFKKITCTNNYKDIHLKVLNNRGYNIYLKYIKWEKMGKNIQNELEKDTIKELKDKRKKFEVEKEEIQNALKAKNELQELISDENFYLYEDITPYHIEAWKGTCRDIDKLIKKNNEWKEIQKEMLKN